MTVALIPAAGVGERLRPFTHTKPKPLVFVAGKPIIAHMLDSLVGVADEIVVIVGYMKEKLISYLEENYSDRFSFRFVEQRHRLGLGHAVYLGLREVSEGPLLITLGDEFFGISYAEMMKLHERNRPCDGSLGVKYVDRPQQYGIVEVEDGIIKHLVEKPQDPTSNVAIAGVYIIEDIASLRHSLEKVIESAGIPLDNVEDFRNGGHNEVQLTDALEHMVSGGSVLKTFDVPVWYDCGRPEMLLKVNRVLLDRIGESGEVTGTNTVVNTPSSIAPGCTIENSVIGPYVSVDRDTVIRNCVISNSIIGSGVVLENVVLSQSIIGDQVQLIEKVLEVNIGENTVIRLGGINGQNGTKGK